MGLTCKPIGKNKSIMAKLDNYLEEKKKRDEEYRRAKAKKKEEVKASSDETV